MYHAIPTSSILRKVFTSGITPFDCMRYETISQAPTCTAVLSIQVSTWHRSDNRDRLEGVAPFIGSARLHCGGIFPVVRRRVSAIKSSTMARNLVRHWSSEVSSCSTNNRSMDRERFLHAICIAMPFFKEGSAPVARSKQTRGVEPKCTAMARGYPWDELGDAWCNKIIREIISRCFQGGSRMSFSCI